MKDNPLSESMDNAGQIPAQGVTLEDVFTVEPLASRGEFNDALAIVRNAKATYPRNIFLIALEKQLEKLTVYSSGSELSDPEEKAELLSSLPTLVIRAISGMQNEQGTLQAIPELEPNEATSDTVHDENKDALEELKKKYIEHADEHLKEGEYDHALVEIRRVLIIDPEDQLAKAYERKIRELKAPAQEAPARTVDVEPNPPLDHRTFPPQASVHHTPTIADTPHREHFAYVAPRQMEPAGGEKTTRHFPLILVVASAVAFLLLSIVYVVFFLPGETENGMDSMVGSNTKPATTQSNENLIKPMAQNPVSTLNTSTTHAKESAPDTQATMRTGNRLESNVSASSSESIHVAENLPQPIEEQKSGVVNNEATKKITGPTTEQIFLENVPKNGGSGTDEKPKNQMQPLQLAPLKIAANMAPSIEQSAAPKQIAATEKLPAIVRLEQPHVPESAFLAGDGEVIVRVQISPDGKPLQAKIEKSNNPLIDDAVIEAVMHSQYSPGIMSSGPVTTWIRIPFKLRRQ